MYVWVQKIARIFTMRMSDNALSQVSGFLALILTGYAKSIAKLRARRAPMYGYLTTTYMKVSKEFRKIVIFDQLNPGWSHYYSEKQLRRLLLDGGFESVQIEEKGGYSWTAVCTR